MATSGALVRGVSIWVIHGLKLPSLSAFFYSETLCTPFFIAPFEQARGRAAGPNHGPYCEIGSLVKVKAQGACRARLK
jgi:hypothetical protein